MGVEWGACHQDFSKICFEKIFLKMAKMKCFTHFILESKWKKLPIFWLLFFYLYFWSLIIEDMLVFLGFWLNWKEIVETFLFEVFKVLFFIFFPIDWTHHRIFLNVVRYCGILAKFVMEEASFHSKFCQRKSKIKCFIHFLWEEIK